MSCVLLYHCIKNSTNK